MARDTATFTLALLDRLSGPARKIEQALGRMRGGVSSASKTTGRFTKVNRKARIATGEYIDSQGRARTANGKYLKITNSAKNKLGQYVDANGRARTASGKFLKVQKQTALAVQQTGKATKQTGQAMKQTAKDAEKSQSFLGRVAETALGFVTGGLVLGAIHKTWELTKAVAETGYEYLTFQQNARLAYQQLTKHGVAADKLMEHARELAKTFGLDILETTDAYKHFLALQFNPRQIDDLVRFGGDMRALGSSAEEVQGIFLALGEMKSIGVLHQRQLLMLENRNVSGKLIREALAQRLGKTVDQVNSMLSQGEIKADVGIQAIEDAVVKKLQEKSLGESGLKYATSTIDGILGRIKAYTQDTGLKLVERVIGPATQIMLRAFTKFEKFLESAKGQQFVDRISKALGNAMTAIDKFLSQGLTGDSIKGLFDQMLTAVTPAAEALGAAIGRGILSGVTTGFQAGFSIDGLFGPKLAKGKTGAETLAGIKDRKDKYGPLLSGSVLSDDKLAALKGALAQQQNMSTFDMLVAAVKNTLGIQSPSKVFQKLGQQTTAGFAKGMGKGASGIAEKNLAGPVVQGTRSALDMHSPSRVFRAMGAHASAGFAEGMAAGPASAAPGSWLGSDLATGSRGGPISVSIEVNVQGAADADATARAAGREVRREMESFFRQLAAEAG